jgi:hypothetical protein
MRTREKSPLALDNDVEQDAYYYSMSTVSNTLSSMYSFNRVARRGETLVRTFLRSLHPLNSLCLLVRTRRRLAEDQQVQ